MPMPSRAISRLEGLLAWLLLAPAGLLAAEQAPTAQAQAPRAYGYFVGDVVQQRVQLELPGGWALDLQALPRSRRPGQALELRQALLQGRELLLEYQVFAAPAELRLLELPTLQLRLQGPGGAEHTLRVEGSPLLVAPLLPAQPSPRTGLGELRPDQPLPLPATQGHAQRLLLYAAAALLLGLLWWQLKYGLPYSRRRQQPFAQAARALRHLGGPPEAQGQAAFRLLHEALNRSAGQVLFAEGLPAFLQQRPAFAPLQAELQEFFRRSEQAFFAGSAPAPGGETLAWLRGFAQRALQAERDA